MLSGRSGKERLNRLVYHKTAVPPEVLEFQDLVSQHFRPLTETIPLLSDRDLSALDMPVQYFGGDHDALLDSQKSAARLRSLVPQAETHLLKDTGHVIVDRFPEIRAFLEGIRI
jgi:pimeloyl-ACP methyl ester carboxylesterase